MLILTTNSLKSVLILSLLLSICVFTSAISAAPFEIEGIIKQVRTIQVKEPYTFNSKPVVSVYIVGLRYGKDYDFQYMVVKDSTKLDGISFSGLKAGAYVRVKGRAEPPGMVGKPIEEIRTSRYGCCNYALRVDTIFTPRNITGSITHIQPFSTTEVIATVRENKTNAKDYKYLIVSDKTTIQNGKFSDIKVSVNITIANATINVPVPLTVDCGLLRGADLFAKIVTVNKNVNINIENRQEISVCSKSCSPKLTVYTVSGRKVFSVKEQTENRLSKRSVGTQTLLLNGNAISLMKRIPITE